MKTYFIVFGVFLLLNLPSAIADSLQEPVLTIVETNYKKIYRIQLFGNGEISYFGVSGVKKLGKHKAKIKKSVLIYLLHELDNTEVMKNYNKDERFKARSVASSGIRLKKNNQIYDFLHIDDELEKFKNDVIKKSNLEKWTTDYKIGNPCGSNCIYSFEELN